MLEIVVYYNWNQFNTEFDFNLYEKEIGELIDDVYSDYQLIFDSEACHLWVKAIEDGVEFPEIEKAIEEDILSIDIEHDRFFEISGDPSNWVIFKRNLKIFLKHLNPFWLYKKDNFYGIRNIKWIFINLKAKIFPLKFDDKLEGDDELDDDFFV